MLNCLALFLYKDLPLINFFITYYQFINIFGIELNIIKKKINAAHYFIKVKYKGKHNPIFYKLSGLSFKLNY